MKQPKGIQRRTLVKGISASALIPLLGSNLLGCSDSSDRNRQTQEDTVAAEFLHGVASGDPLHDRVILWTRLTPERNGRVSVEWQISTDEAFGNIVNSGAGSTDAEVDYTVKVDADGLEPGSQYYYRFYTGDNVSPLGRTRTVAMGALAGASFAVVSCSNYPAGFFNVYREIANQQVDAVLHLGDYLYEYDENGYASELAEEIGRVVKPANELLSLADYRTRYGQYHTDADLQSCHAAHPFIIVWDDHEVANDAWRAGADNHDPDTEGDYSQRRAGAIQAWYEWLPVRPPGPQQDIIYRRFQYGDLLDLLMLDTRHVGRDRQVAYSDYISGEMIDVDGVRAATADSSRTLLGETQRDWLKASLSESTTRWQVLGQQILMARQPLPEPIARALTPELAGQGALDEAIAAVVAAAVAKSKPPQDRTSEEQALLDSAIPFNPDAWDGYSFEREDILTHAAQLQSRLVVLAGDTHNGWASQLSVADGTPVGIEFAGPSVSSPGAEAVIGEDAAIQFGPFAVTLIDDLRYSNLVNRGYMKVSFDRDRVHSEYRYVSAVETRDYTLAESLGRQFTVDRDDLLLA